MHVQDLAVEDYFKLPNALADGPEVDATVSFDVVWSKPVTRRFNFQNTTAVDPFAGEFVENQVTVSWSGSNANGFSFTSNPGNFSTSVDTFSELSHVRNGSFFPGDPVLEAAAPQVPVQQTLTAQQLQPVLQAAIADWQAAGASAAQVAALNQATVHIASLPPSYLGAEAGNQIWISPNAAGWGWFMDASPASNLAFPAIPGRPAYGKMDLLSVVDHELGHVLGLGDSQDLHDVMGETLAAGVRRLPSASDLFTGTVQPTTPLAAGSPVSSSLATSGDHEAALLANILAAGFQTSPTPAGNLVSTSAAAPFVAQPPVPVDTGSRNSTYALLLTQQVPASPMAILDQVFAAVAVKPLDYGLYTGLVSDLTAP